MMVFMLVVLVVIFALLVIVSGVSPQRSALSQFELERRQANGESAAVALLRRERLLVDIISLQRAASALLLVCFVAVAIARFDWALGILLSVVAALTYGAVARWGFLQKRSQKLYKQYEPSLLRLVEKFARLSGLLRTVIPGSDRQVQLASRQELQHLITQSHGLMTADEKAFLTHGLAFASRQVSEIMTPRSAIDSISKKEMLGPLVLDDLHKTGHSRFPVIDKDLDHIIGVLHVRDMLTLDIKRSVTAEKAMESRVFYIHEKQTLSQAMAAFLRTHHHLLIVINESHETVGLLSLNDTIEAMIGRKIVDEFETHDDIQSVAKRSPRAHHSEK
ncbi:MAG TPA: CBS domain-containing protein [Candidatus Saccharimonadales bacterium]|nr:CBS domain-containing protein [Candidatus Saccharimonadales bacterium]